MTRTRTITMWIRLCKNAMNIPPGPTKGMKPVVNNGMYWISKNRINGTIRAHIFDIDQKTNVFNKVSLEGLRS